MAEAGRVGGAEVGGGGCSGVGIGCANPILSGGCSAGWEGHSGAGLGGSGNFGNDGAENSGTGLASKVFPLASRTGAIGTLDIGPWTLDSISPSWNFSNVSRAACAT